MELMNCHKMNSTNVNYVRRYVQLLGTFPSVKIYSCQNFGLWKLSPVEKVFVGAFWSEQSEQRVSLWDMTLF